MARCTEAQQAVHLILVLKKRPLLPQTTDQQMQLFLQKTEAPQTVGHFHLEVREKSKLVELITQMPVFKEARHEFFPPERTFVWDDFPF